MTDLVQVAGIGSPHGDDQIGWIVARLIQEKCGALARVGILSSPFEILHWVERCTRLVLIDALNGHGNLGGLRHWVWPTEQLATSNRSGTHSISLPDVLQMGQQLQILPSVVSLWGIEGRLFGPGEPLSPILIDAAPGIAEQIVAAELHEVVANA